MIEILLVLLLIFILFVLYLFWRDAHTKKLIQEGKAAYFVKIAMSGNGSVYHGLTCGKCVGGTVITETEAISAGYPHVPLVEGWQHCNDCNKRQA